MSTVRRIVHISLAGVLLAFGIGLQSAAAAIPLDVLIDTSVLFGTDAQLAFDFIDGDGLINNSAVITGFTTDGLLGSASSVGGVSGSLPGTVTISDTDFFNELLQELTLGNSIAFTLDLTSNFAGGVPDAFSFFLLDDTASTSLVTTDLPGDALFLVDIDGSPTSSLAVSGSTAPNDPAVRVSVTTTAAPIPEPGTFIFLLLGVPGLLQRGTRKFSQA